MTSARLSEKKPVFVSRIPIRWGDMDAMGHVNNAVFFRYLEQARIEWYSHIGRGGKRRSGNCRRSLLLHLLRTARLSGGNRDQNIRRALQAGRV